MNILITGGTGFIGSTITKFFLQQNNYITILSRGRSKVLKPVRVIESINQINANEKINIIINLAGSPINKKWNKTYKEILISSRVEVTKSLITLIKALKEKPDLLISASAIGYYGTQNNKYLDETSSYIDDFTHELCNLWELEAQKAQELGVRTCITRLGVVLGKNGGALEKILPLFKLGLGGNIGSGKQFFSWIHLDDVIGIFNFLISNKEQKGIYNLTSPSPTTNSQFTKALSRTLKRPDFFTVPSFLIKMVFGEMGDKLLLNGSAVYPKKLLDNGYEFKFKTIESVLKNITDK
ncbi:MAG: TIGR01777 family oxidoreductase [Rickettsiaceae bacterium]|jgi:uncharacterized protein|nr:TIGR01777 family oxidoreductase [Rickettsiaceae bacterium]